MKTTTQTESKKTFDKWFGFKCSFPSKEEYDETTITTCDLCHKKRIEMRGIEILLHVPMVLRSEPITSGPTMRTYFWGYNKKEFHACAKHTEIELDKAVSKWKKHLTRKDKKV